MKTTKKQQESLTRNNCRQPLEETLEEIATTNTHGKNTRKISKAKTTTKTTSDSHYKALEEVATVNTHDKNTKKISKPKTATNNNKKQQLTAPKKTLTDMRPQKNPKIKVVALIPFQNWSEYPFHKVFLHYIEN